MYDVERRCFHGVLEAFAIQSGAHDPLRGCVNQCDYITLVPQDQMGSLV